MTKHKNLVVLVIPARGGSKGIPLKNIQPVGGISLIGRAIASGLGARLVDHVYVSSDSEVILSEASANGALMHKRGGNSASDQASTEDALIDFLSSLEAHKPDILVYLQCTSPFIKSEDIDRAVGMLLENNSLDTVFSAREDHSFLWQHSDDQLTAVGLNHQGYKQRKRRQDLKKTFCEDGAIYALKVDSFVSTGNRFGNAASFIEIENGLPFEIDSLFELEMARLCEPAYPSQFPISEKIQLLVSDFDGVMTPDSLYINEQGVESIQCTRSDGMGVSLLRKADVETVILSTEVNSVVAKRAEKLKIECFHGESIKLDRLRKIAEDRGLEQNQIAYVGNDVNDVECLEWVGLPMIPNNACDSLKKMGFHQLKTSGGNGVIREVATLLVKK